jgi:hypothetical protein
MRVYHGSSVAISEIDLSKSLPGRDFGQGFYVTNIRRQAEIWAERKAAELHNKEVITEFEFNEYAYRYDKLKTLYFEGYSEEWFDFIILNRSSMTRQVHDYDIVEGPVADDQVASQIFLFQEGRLAKQQFLEKLKFKKATHQICFCTPPSLQMLTLIRKNADAAIMQISEQIVEALMVEYGWNELQATRYWYLSDTYAMLTDESTELYQQEWREVYGLLMEGKRE